MSIPIVIILMGLVLIGGIVAMVILFSKETSTSTDKNKVIQEIARQVKQEVKEEIREEVRQEVRQEVKQHVRQEILPESRIDSFYLVSDDENSNKLRVGDVLFSENRKYQLQLKSNGNLVLFDSMENDIAWESNTYISNPNFAIIQPDGNFGLLNKNNNLYWSTNSGMFQGGSSMKHFKVVLQDDRNLVVLGVFRDERGLNQIWDSNSRVSPSMLKGDIKEESTLNPGGKLTSKHNRCNLVYQPDGNLVLYTSNGKDVASVWSANVTVKNPFKAIMQPDGNFVLYDSEMKSYWSTETANKGSGFCTLVLQDDRNLVIYDKDGTVVWQSNTAYYPNKLNSEGFEHILFVGEMLVSENKKYQLNYQPDGNLVLYAQDSDQKKAIWSANVSVKNPLQANLSKSGDLILYDDNFISYWSTGTSDKGEAPYSFNVQDDGNIVIYDKNNTALWSRDMKEGFFQREFFTVPQPFF